MAKHPFRALSPIKLGSLKPGIYADGNCLYLIVEPSGTKHWICRTTINGKRCDIGVGGLSYVSLADARDKAATLRAAARAGGDPLTDKLEKKKAAAKERDTPTFEKAAREVYRAREKTFRNPIHKKHWIESMEKFVFPVIGKVRVDQVTSAHVLEILNNEKTWNPSLDVQSGKPKGWEKEDQTFWLRIPDTAKRTKQRMKVILAWAKAAGHRSGDNPVDEIEEVLPQHEKTDEHYASLPYAEVPAFIQTLRDSDGAVSGRLAFEFLILTASRTGEVIKAKWNEIDFKSQIWTRPKENMKSKREHKVPLSPRCVEILEQAKKLNGGEYVFPGMRTGAISLPHLSNMVFIATLKRMGKTDITPHGFRSSFRDWAEEKSNHRRRTIEESLAHKVKDDTEKAYLRSDVLELRRELMNAWATFAATGSPKGKRTSARSSKTTRPQRQQENRDETFDDEIAEAAATGEAERSQRQAEANVAAWGTAAKEAAAETKTLITAILSDGKPHRTHEFTNAVGDITPALLVRTYEYRRTLRREHRGQEATVERKDNKSIAQKKWSAARTLVDAATKDLVNDASIVRIGPAGAKCQYQKAGPKLVRLKA